MLIPDDIHVHQIVLDLDEGSVDVYAGLRRTRQTVAKRHRTFQFSDLTPTRRARLRTIRDMVLAAVADDEGFMVERIVINPHVGERGAEFVAEGRYELQGGGRTATIIKRVRREPYDEEELAARADPSINADGMMDIVEHTLDFDEIDETDYRAVVQQVTERFRTREELPEQANLKAQRPD